MSNLVCRAITLYSYHIPIGNSSLLPQYTTIGFFDGMYTKNIHVEYQEKDFKALWEYTMEQTRKCDGSYSFQNIFVMSDDDCNDDCTDSIIWDENTDKEYPLTMLVFLQLKEYISGVDEIKKQCEGFNSLARNYLREGLSYVYASIDKNDFVVCLKCRNYHNAVETIKALHTTDKNVIYCYSVFSVSNAVLSDFSKENYAYLFEEKIESICLKGITNSIRDSEHILGLDEKYWDFCEKMAKRLYEDEKREEIVGIEDGKEICKNKDRIYDILGDNDFRYIARYVNLGNLLREFAQGGMLSYSDSDFSFYLFSSSLVLNTQTKDYEKLEDDLVHNIGERMKQAIATVNCDRVASVLDSIYNIIENEYSENDKLLSIYHALYQLLQSFRVLEVSPAKRYDFFSMFHPFEMLVEIVKEKLEQGKDISEESEIFDFIHKISMTFHNAQRTDIQFFQIQDFNVIIHYAPTKLRAFYAMWVLSLAKLYKAFKPNSDKYYSFIFAPEMFGITEVKQLFLDSEETRRLMLIALPDRAIYNIKRLTIVLSHEVAHIGCERKREKRHESALKIVARAVIFEIHAFMLDDIKMTGELLDQAVHIKKIRNDRNLLKELEDRLMEENQIILGQFNSGERDNECRRKKSREHITTAFENVMRSYGKKVIADYCCHIKNEYIYLIKCKRNNGIYLNWISRIFNAQQSGLSQFINIFKNVQLDKVVQIVYYIEEEAFSDLITVITLGHSMENYIKSFTFGEITVDDVSGNTEEGTAGMVRMALVIETVGRIIEDSWIIEHMPEFINKWRKGQLEKLCNEFPEGSVEQYISGQILCYMDGLRNVLDDISSYMRMYDSCLRDFVNNTYDFLNDRVVFEAMNNYLYECADAYIKKLITNDDIYKRKYYIANVYQQLQSSSYLDVLQIIEDFLCENEESCIEK